MKGLHLYRGFKVIKMRDSSPLRTSMYSRYLEINTFARLVDKFCNSNKGGVLSSFIYVFWYAYNFSKIRLKNGDPRTITTYEYSNEERSIREFYKKIDWNLGQSLEKSIPSPYLFLTVFFDLSNLAKLIRIVRTIGKRENFLVTCRSLEFLANFSFLEKYLAGSKNKIAVLSSDVNPNGVALTAFVQKNNFKSIFFNHGIVTAPLPKLDYSLSLIDCEASWDVYKRSGHTVVYQGSKINEIQVTGESKKLGVCLSTFPSLDQVFETCKEFEKLGYEVVFIRPHPNELTYSQSELDELQRKLPKAEVNATSSLKDQLALVDFCLAGSTSAHIDVLMYGKPSLYFNSFDEDPGDLFGFIEKGLVLDGTGKLGENLAKEIDLFYKDTAWLKAAHYFGLYSDFSYVHLEEVIKKLTVV